MPDTNDKLTRFRQIILEDAKQDRKTLLRQVTAERKSRLQAAEANLKRSTDDHVQAMSNRIYAETGRQVSRKMLADKREVASRREEMARELFAQVREMIAEFTETEDYLSHLKALYREAFEALGNPYDGVILLRPSDMKYARELAAVLPGRHVTFQEGSFTLGGLIVDCHSRLQRADQSYDTALGDLDGHFAEMFGLSLADD